MDGDDQVVGGPVRDIATGREGTLVGTAGPYLLASAAGRWGNVAGTPQRRPASGCRGSWRVPCPECAGGTDPPIRW